MFKRDRIWIRYGMPCKASYYKYRLSAVFFVFTFSYPRQSSSPQVTAMSSANMFQRASKLSFIGGEFLAVGRDYHLHQQAHDAGESGMYA
jgi:hypothetical protein